MKRKKQQQASKTLIAWRFIRRLVPYALVLVMLSTGLIYFKQVQFKTVLPIRQVSVEGALKHLDRNQIKTRVMNNIEGGYFTLNLTHIRERIMKNAWIKSVSIRRRWPALLIVNVKEKKAVAYWNKHAFISAEGEVFKPVNMDTAMMLPHMYGPEGQQKKVWMFMNRIYPSLASLPLRVDALYLDKRRAWKLVLSYSAAEETTVARKQDETLTLRLGRYDTDTRFNRFIHVFSRVDSPDLKQIKTIDMRYPNGFSVLKKASLNEKNKLIMSDVSNSISDSVLGDRAENKPETNYQQLPVALAHLLLPMTDTVKEV